MRFFPCPVFPCFHALHFLFGRLGKVGQFVFKRADVVRMHFNVLDYIFRCTFSVAFMHDKFTDKLVDGGGGVSARWLALSRSDMLSWASVSSFFKGNILQSISALAVRSGLVAKNHTASKYRLRHFYDNDIQFCVNTACRGLNSIDFTGFFDKCCIDTRTKKP